MTHSTHDGEAENHQRREASPPKKTLSEALVEVAEDTSREFITIGTLMSSLEGRARAALILVFAFPNALPAIPGTSGILGLPLLYLTFQMMLGRNPWLPKIISDRGLSRARFAQLIDRLVPYLTRTERLLRPRWRPLSGHTAEHFLGLICLILAIVLTLPVPLGNMLPAFSMCLIALGILERDGLWVILGLISSVIALVISFGVVYAIFHTVAYLVIGALGL